MAVYSQSTMVSGIVSAVNPKGIKLSAPQPTQVIIEGANKEIVGQVAAELRSIRPPALRSTKSPAGRALARRPR